MRENEGQRNSVKQGKAFENIIYDCLCDRGFRRNVPYRDFTGGNARGDFGKENIIIEAKSIEPGNRGNVNNQVLAIRENAIANPEKRFILVLNHNGPGWHGRDQYIIRCGAPNLTTIIFMGKEQFLYKLEEKGLL